MFFYEYGKENERTVVMLHGANFVHSFGKQYALADKYHIVIPHIMGFGDAAETVFETESCVAELAEFIKGFGKKVTLVGFSLGAQLAVKLVAEHEELFNCAVVVSPWLIKEEPMLSKVLQENEKQFASFKKKWLCRIIGTMNGLPPKQCKEFVAQMQNVKLETIRNCVDNKITLSTIPNFTGVKIPVIAIAGKKEQKEVQNSVIGLSLLCKSCRNEIWDKAAHNIPPLFSKRFNKLLTDTIEHYNFGYEVTTEWE